MVFSMCFWNVVKWDEYFIELKKNGGWLRYFNVFRCILSFFLLLLWKLDGVFEKRKVMGVVYCICICLMLNICLWEFYKNIFLKFFLCVCLNWFMKIWIYIVVGFCFLRYWIVFLCLIFYSGLLNCFLKNIK